MVLNLKCTASITLALATILIDDGKIPENILYTYILNKKITSQNLTHILLLRKKIVSCVLGHGDLYYVYVGQTKKCGN